MATAIGNRVRRWLVVGVAAVAICSIVVVLSIDAIAAAAVRSIGSASLGVPVNVESVHLGLLDPPTTVDGLAISNPAGCQKPHFVAADRIEVSATVGDLAADDVRIPLVRIVGLRVDVERMSSGKLNLSAMLDASRASAAAAGSGGTTRRIRIAELELVDVTLSAGAHVSIVPLGASVHAERITLRNVDSTATGLGVTDQLIGIVVDRVVGSVVEHFGDQIVAGARGVIESALERLGGAAGAGESLGESLKDALGEFLPGGAK